MSLLFVHGAGGYAEDRVLAHEMADHLGVGLDLPRLPDEDMSVGAWAGPVRRSLDRLGPEDHVVAHSFGATILLHVLAHRSAPSAGVTLLAMPDWGPEDWDVEDYVPPTLAPEFTPTLHHCRDDEVVPFDHLALAVARLPGVRFVTHDAGGHQFDGLADELSRGLSGR